MKGFTFHIPTKIYFGDDEFSHLGEEVADHGSTVLLTYGGGSIKRTGLYDRVRAQLAEQGLTVVELGGIDPNPRIDSVRQGAALCREAGVDVVLAVGGGSTIDCSKFICAAAVADCDPWDWFADKTTPIEDALPLVCVLTLAATGSEMDNGGVISNPETNQKEGRGADCLLPRASFLDPANTFTVPPFQTAAGSADIISHTCETYFSQDDDLYFLDTFMEGLLRTVIRFAPVAMERGDDYEARANLMWASSWAINGFADGGKTQAWSVHPMEHELSAFYDITHGLGLAILTPAWMRHVLATDPATLPKFVQFAENVFGICDPAMGDAEKAEAGIQALQDFFVNDLGLAASLSAIGIDDEHFSAMAEKACHGPSIKGFVELTPADVEQIYRACL
ncbi:iron-containing alcohol dehydrogenase [Atopobiaceae bacterium 24-176]